MENESKPTVLVTGSSGLIGQAVIRRLAADYTVVGFDVMAPDALQDADFVEVDLTSDASVAQGLAQVRDQQGARVASVIHLAAYYDFSGEPSPKYDAITVRGTGRLLRHLHDFDVEQFIFSSTMLVHAPCAPGERIDEEWPLEPGWDYPESKVKTERLIREQRGDIPVVLLRIAGVYDDVGHSIPIAHQIQRVYEKKLTGRVFPGDTAHGQAYLHLDDLVEAFARLVQRRAALPEALTLLLGEEETLSYDQVQDMLGHLLHGEDWETHEIPETIAKVGAWVQDKTALGGDPFIKPWMVRMADAHYALDLSRVRRYLDWEPEHTLSATLPKMVEALQQDPLGWYREHDLEPPKDLEAHT
jgi:nucleoside-diphosphate-sugar epimerase